MARFDSSKVYGGAARHCGEQCRAIAFAPTKKRLLEITGQSIRHFNNYWCVTGNLTELKLVHAARLAGETEGVWAEVGRSFSGNYTRANLGEVDGH